MSFHDCPKDVLLSIFSKLRVNDVRFVILIRFNRFEVSFMRNCLQVVQSSAKS